MEDYQALCRQLEAVECSMPAVGLVEETEERLVERICLYQARNLMHAKHLKTLPYIQNVLILTI